MTSDQGQILITLPLHYDDDYTLRYLLHELMHVNVAAELSSWCDPWAERILDRVLEPALMQHLLDTPRKHSWWLAQLGRLRA